MSALEAASFVLLDLSDSNLLRESINVEDLGRIGAIDLSSVKFRLPGT